MAEKGACVAQGREGWGEPHEPAGFELASRPSPRHPARRVILVQGRAGGLTA